ncbi:hypothetical protein CLOLEP_00621 [[Clostridium] leptum DSM 753]|uniref:Uncharacterized protein n=1 Tax=[Clostridium] leptum DSM 753 TaxID=428125 RepID=A7VPZ4_9FIRM|nr:hypothetical protein CLOLEP_00621 [[Clostridium] leptum DSM 753]
MTKLLSAGLIPFGINLLNKNQKGTFSKMRSPSSE